MLFVLTPNYFASPGRVFEVEADVRDTACFDVLAATNKCTSLEYEANDKIRAVRPCNEHALTT
jgi:phage tail protein X